MNGRRLCIHAGLHKTGTSSFQETCSSHQTKLAEIGVYYPVFDGQSDHNTPMHDLQSNGPTSLQVFLRRAENSCPENCEVVLLSGEDFENCIVDADLADTVEVCAMEAGFATVEWSVTYRDVPSYVASLYAQMSKHSSLVDYELLGQTAKRLGYATIASRGFVYLFALDYHRVAARFKTPSRRHSEREMGAFLAPFPGFSLISELVGEAAATAFFARIGDARVHTNSRISEWDVELFYVLNFVKGLSFRKNTSTARRSVLKLLLAPLLYFRVKRRRAAHRQLFGADPAGSTQRLRAP